MIDPNEAPDGFTAMEPTGYGGCSGCVFRIDGGGCSRTYGQETSCDAHARNDRESVIFIKREAMNITTHGSRSAMKAEDVRAALTVAIGLLHHLRDEFAKAALMGAEGIPWRKATTAYEVADAMLAAKFSTMTWGQK